jgi:SAM-dependent methyltransferase
MKYPDPVLTGSREPEMKYPDPFFSGSNRAVALTDEIARTLDAPLALLPWLPELFADLEELGGTREDVLGLLRPLGLARGASVLDLGCGKGAVAVALARELGWRVTGVDAMPAFVEHARNQARAWAVEHLCRFECGDLRATLAHERGYDVVLLLAVGRPWGSLAATIGALRAAARPGGWLVLDDGYLDRAGAPAPDGYGDRDATLRELGAHGDRLAREILGSSAGEAFQHDSFPLFERRARTLAARQPQLAALVEEFLELQRRETQALRTTIVPALWLLQRGT